MFGAILSFLSGGVFRLLIGQVAGWLDKRQEHLHEIERARLQMEADAAQHARNLEAIKVQAELGVKTIQVQADAAVTSAEADAWRQAVASAVDPADNSWAGMWNKAIRPAAASIVLALWCLALWRQGFITNEWDRDVMGAVLGFFFASRALGKK